MITVKQLVQDISTLTMIALILGAYSDDDKNLKKWKQLAKSIMEVVDHLSELLGNYSITLNNDHQDDGA